MRSAMNFSLKTFLCALFIFFSVISAAPTQKRDVFVPPVLTPRAKTVWKIGTTQEVTWDISSRPAQITNTRGTIILAKDGLLDINHPLATGFDILTGTHKIVVPKVVPGHDYQIVVFGDSGNSSPKFTIAK